MALEPDRSKLVSYRGESALPSVLRCAERRPQVRDGGNFAGGGAETLSVCRSIFSHAADGGADGAARLIFGDRLGENQFGSQAKGGGQAGAAIDNRDGHGIMAVVSATANVKDQFGGGKILAIDETPDRSFGN